MTRKDLSGISISGRRSGCSYVSLRARAIMPNSFPSANGSKKPTANCQNPGTACAIREARDPNSRNKQID